MYKDIFTSRLKGLMKEKRITNEKLAEKMNISTSSVKKWKEKKTGNYPTIDNLLLLAHIFNVDLGFLIGDQDCKRMHTQKLSELSNLDYNACEVLEKLSLENAKTLSAFISHSQFIELLNQFTEFVNSPSIVGFEDDGDELSEKDKAYNSKCELLKYHLVSCFDDTVRDIRKRNSVVILDNYIKLMQKEFTNSRQIINETKEKILETICNNSLSISEKDMWIELLLSMFKHETEMKSV